MNDPLKVPAWLFEQCLRAYHRAPADKPSLELLKSFEVDPGHFERALQIAYNAGIKDCSTDIAMQLHGYDSVLWGKDKLDDRPAEEAPADGGE